MFGRCQTVYSEFTIGSFKPRQCHTTQSKVVFTTLILLATYMVYVVKLFLNYIRKNIHMTGVCKHAVYSRIGCLVPRFLPSIQKAGEKPGNEAVQLLYIYIGL